MFDLHFPTRQPERPLDPPELPGFNGDVVFAGYVGDGTVEVFAVIEEDLINREQTEVKYQGVDVAPLLNEEQWVSLQDQFANNYETICHFDRLDYWEE
jgi:hypothetical protein